MALFKSERIRPVQMCVSRPRRILAELFAEFGSFKLEQKNGDASCGYCHQVGCRRKFRENPSRLKIVRSNFLFLAASLGRLDQCFDKTTRVVAGDPARKRFHQ